MRVVNNTVIKSGLVGEVKSIHMYPNTEFIKEIKKIMERYKIDYMWFAWSKFEGVVEGKK